VTYIKVIIQLNFVACVTVRRITLFTSRLHEASSKTHPTIM